MVTKCGWRVLSTPSTQLLVCEVIVNLFSVPFVYSILSLCPEAIPNVTINNIRWTKKKCSGGQHMLSHVIYTRTHVELMECTGAHIFTSYQSVMEWAEEICQEENSLPSANMMRIFDIAISFWNLVDVCVGSGTTTVRRSQCILPHLGYWQHAVAVKCVSQLQPAPRRIFFILLRVSFANAIWLLARQKAIMKV